MSNKILLKIASMVKPEDTALKQYFISNSELMKITESSEKNLYQNVEAAINDIEENVYKEKKSEDKFGMMPWFSFCHYKKEEGLYVAVNPLVKKKILEFFSDHDHSEI